MNKHFYTLIPLCLYICFLITTPLSSQTPTASFSNWKDNKKAAYSIIHDDYSNYVTGIFNYADPIATARGIKLCFGAITNYCGATEWANARTMISHGHECVNHSHNHLCGGTAGQCSGLSTYGSAQFATELGLSTQLIETNTGVKPRFFIHPYDATTTAINNYLAGLGYLGTRAGTQEAVNTSSFTNFMNLNFHVYSPSSPISSLNQAVDQAVASGGYAIREFHGVADGSWAAMTVANYTNHLDYVKTQMNNGNIWSTTTTEAITYKMQRDAFQPIASYTASTGVIVVGFNVLKSIDPSVLRTPVTLNINLNGITGNYDVTQNGSIIPSVRSGNIVSVNVYPHQGTVTLTCTDCTPPPVTSNVTKLTASAQTNAALVTWVNPLSTFNNILIVAKEGSGFTTKPASATYTANANFTGNGTAFEGGKVVYQGTGTSVNVTNLTAGRTYFFRAYVRNGTTWTDGVETSVTLSGPPTSNLGCLQASYFNNVNLSGTPHAVRFETSINNNWGTGAPNVAGINANNFSVRWNGNFTAARTGTYRFTARADDGVRVWINNTQIINQWRDQSATSFSATVNLTQGVSYNIKMEYYERGGNALAQLSWTEPGQTNQIMPFSPNCTTLNNVQQSDMISLDGRLNKDKAALQWVVNTKKEVDYYQIEKRDAQGAFQAISLVNDNNQTTIRLYSFVDEKLLEGDNDYRIQTVFADNTPPQYSDELTINYIKADIYNVFPNPAHDYAYIDLSAIKGKSVDIHISSLLGTELYREKIQATTNTIHRIDISHLNAGPYMIRIAAEGTRPVTRKLMVGH